VVLIADLERGRSLQRGVHLLLPFLRVIVLRVCVHRRRHVDDLHAERLDAEPVAQQLERAVEPRLAVVQLLNRHVSHFVPPVDRIRLKEP
jgi:hypothetical protein